MMMMIKMDYLTAWVWPKRTPKTRFHRDGLTTGRMNTWKTNLQIQIQMEIINDGLKSNAAEPIKRDTDGDGLDDTGSIFRSANQNAGRNCNIYPNHLR
jgi:hypothetical protein